MAYCCKKIRPNNDINLRSDPPGFHSLSVQDLFVDPSGLEFQTLKSDVVPTVIAYADPSGSDNISLPFDPAIPTEPTEPTESTDILQNGSLSENTNNEILGTLPLPAENIDNQSKAPSDVNGQSKYKHLPDSGYRDLEGIGE
jgi:hypothetical protein